MDVTRNIIFGFNSTASATKEAGKEDRITRLDWLIPTIVNLVLILITTLILVSLVHYGLTSGKWRGQSSSQVDKLNAGVVYTFLIVCAVMCIGRYISNQIYMNVGFDYNNDTLCEVAGDAAFAFYVLVIASVFLFLWFRQKAFYTNNMLAFKTTKCIRVLSYSSSFLITVSALPYVLYTIGRNGFETGPTGCANKFESDKSSYFLIYIVFLIVLSQLLLLCLFIYPVLQIGRDSKPSIIQKRSSSINSFATRPFDKKRNITSCSELSRNDSRSSASLHRVSSSVVRQRGDEIKLIIRKTLFFAVASTLLDIIVSIMSYFVFPNKSNRRYPNMLADMAVFCNLLLLVLSFSTYKRMLTSCITSSQ